MPMSDDRAGYGRLDDARAQVEAGAEQAFQSMLQRIPEPEELTEEPYREFDFCLQTNRLHVIGYTTSEVSDLLTLYREHLEAMVRFTQAQQATEDPA